MTALALGLLAWAATGTLAACYLSRLFRAQRARIATMAAALGSVTRAERARQARSRAPDTDAAYRRFLNGFAQRVGDADPIEDVRPFVARERVEPGSDFAREFLR